MKIPKGLILRFILTFAVFFAAGFILQKIYNVDLDALKNLISSFGPLAPAVYSLLLFLGLTVPLNPISDFLLVNLAALLFPPIISTLATFAAHSLALTANYWLADRFGTQILKNLTSEAEMAYLQKLAKHMRPGFIFAARFVLPLTTIGIDVVSYASGLSKISFLKFFSASIIPWTILNFVYFFATSYFQTLAPFLYFAPAIFLIVIPLVFFAIVPSRSPIKKMVRAKD